MELRACIFDLDGVITDTAEYHYLGWQRLADEEGLIFNREINERLRGISRQASLEVILAVNELSINVEKIHEWMERKNRYYADSLENITPDDVLPGVAALFQEIKAAGMKIAIASASKNAASVIRRLRIESLIDVVADGFSVRYSKPAPDLFLNASSAMGVAPAFCAVFEDATAGIEAALSAGMWSVGLGPEWRVGQAHVRYDNLEGVNLNRLIADLESASWTVVDASFEPVTQNHKETIFTIGNGYLCLRGSLEEGHPGEKPACFVHRLWDDRPVNFSELANIPYWAEADIWVNEVRFRLDRGIVTSYRRWLDLHAGLLSRRIVWQPNEEGATIELVFERFVHVSKPHLALLRITVRILQGEATLRVRTGIDDHVENTGLLHWNRIEQYQSDRLAWLLTKTRNTKIDLAVAALVHAHGAASPVSPCDADGQPAVEIHANLRAGETLRVDKYVGVVTSNEAEIPVQEAVRTADEAAEIGFESLFAENRRAWATLWDLCDVTIEGDIEAQLAMRFNLFQLNIAAPRFTQFTSIGAKALSGFGYCHHIFWDCEIFILPLFIYTQPAIAQNMLMYRYHTMPGAREKARRNGYEGAQFAWESAADGSEVTPAWVVSWNDPNRLIRIWTGDLEMHITADIAYAVVQYWHVTGDDRWIRDYGAEIILDGARFWASAFKLEDDGRYHLRNVIGPDENHDHVDDNAYTNLMAKWHLEAALRILDWLKEEHPQKHDELVRALDLDKDRVQRWTEVSERIYFTLQDSLIEQFEGYFNRLPPDFDELRAPDRTLSMQAILGIDRCNETQILKQPDVLMLMYLLPETFTQEQVKANYDYYDPRTDHEHGSSLGPSISAIMAARVGDMDSAYRHFIRAARADLSDVRQNASDGVHAANAGGMWQAAVFGFGGLRLTEDGWMIRPNLPPHWTRLSFKFFHRNQLHRVEIPA